jgi:hypothetical protein
VPACSRLGWRFIEALADQPSNAESSEVVLHDEPTRF